MAGYSIVMCLALSRQLQNAHLQDSCLSLSLNADCFDTQKVRHESRSVSKIQEQSGEIAKKIWTEQGLAMQFTRHVSVG